MAETAKPDRPIKLDWKEIRKLAKKTDPYADYDCQEFDDLVARLELTEPAIIWKHMDVCGSDSVRRHARELLAAVEQEREACVAVLRRELGPTGRDQPGVARALVNAIRAPR